MIIKEAKNFYKQDNKKYIIKENKEFLSWLDKRINNGYHAVIEEKDIQELINYITNWYEIKYPERELEYYAGIKNDNFQNIKKISNVMNIEQLFYRLSHNQLCLMRCDYRSSGAYLQPIYKDGKLVEHKTNLLMKINIKDNSKSNECNIYSRLPYFYINVDSKTGLAKLDYDLEEYSENTDIVLDELLSI